MAERGMGRGLARDPAGLRPARGSPGAARHRDRADRAEPATSRAGGSTRTRCRRWRARSPSRESCSRSSCARCRARATSSSPASAAGAPRSWRGWSVLPAIVERRDDAASLEAAIVENMAREDLNPVEEARAVAALVEELGLTREEVGRRVGRSRVAVSNLLRHPRPARTTCSSASSAGELSEGHGRALLLAEDHADRRSLARDGGRRAAGRCGSSRIARGAPTRPRATARPRGEGACIPTRRRPARRIAEQLGATLGREVRVRAARHRLQGRVRRRGPGRRERLARRLGRADGGLARAAVRTAAPRRHPRYTCPPHGRLAQSVRALL